MAKNDVILLDGILDDRTAKGIPSSRRDEAFEFFAFEQILKDLDLSADEIDEGSIDGRDDGGIDGFFMTVNGHPVVDPESFQWPKADAVLVVWLVTCKLHETFQQAPLDKLVASLTEVLDFGLADDALKGAYSEGLLAKRATLHLAYRKLASVLSRVRFHVAYASRGNEAQVGESVRARADQIVRLVEELFESCDAEFEFIGAAKLVAMHRRVPRFSLELRFSEHLSRGERYILLASLDDFQRFVRDDEGHLRRYLFDSNVRDFMGLNRVNEDILATLRTPSSPDFWWLNNGVTVLATSARVVGKVMHMDDVQIVNGLQTTESIARFFGGGGADPEARSVLVKVIVSTDPVARDAIIRATNNQTAVGHASFTATDKLQRDIEDVMEAAGLYYERRKNFYVNRGIPAYEVVSPLYLASGFVSLILNSPSRASNLRSRFMRNEAAYAAVFNPEFPIEAWPRVARTLRRTDRYLERLRDSLDEPGQRFYKEWRHITAYITVARLLGTFSFGGRLMATFDPLSMTDEVFEETWSFMRQQRRAPISRDTGSKKGFIKSCCRAAATTFGIANVEVVEARDPFRGATEVQPLALDDPFIAEVDAVLPQQPWKPGMHVMVASQLGAKPSKVSRAIQALIATGKWNRQIDGVVFDEAGEVIAIDTERVSGKRLEPED